MVEQSKSIFIAGSTIPLLLEEGVQGTNLLTELFFWLRAVRKHSGKG